MDNVPKPVIIQMAQGQEEGGKPPEAHPHGVRLPRRLASRSNHN
jgi:hypothetical protein